MQTLYGYLKKHWQLDFNPLYYGVVMSFWAFALVFNYWVFPTFLGFQVTVERYLTEQFYFSESGWCAPSFWLFYAVPYFFTLGLGQLLGNNKQTQVLENEHFVTYRDNPLRNSAVWGRASFAMACMAFCVASRWYVHATDGIVSPTEHYYFRKILSTFTAYFFIGLPLFLFWYFYDKKNEAISPTSFYGLTLKKWHWQPYFSMVGVIIVGISIAAILLPQLTNYYPTLKIDEMKGFDLMPPNLAFGIYEVIYGCFYTWAEVLMRGFLVIGMTQVLGRRSIMPMVSMYLFFHLAKPPAEAISSLVGGYLLGIIAYESRNITGGVLLHATVAVTMDIAARLVLLYLV